MNEHVPAIRTARLNQDQINELSKPLDRATVKTREQSGRKLSYIEGWHAIAEANRIFGFDGWSRETVEIKLVAEHARTIGQRKEPGHGVSYIAKVRVIVNGVIREGCGTGHGIDRDLGQAHESALKEAETDAMKRALMTFGNPFGLALYDKLQENVADKRMLKKDHRADYHTMLAELDHTLTPHEWAFQNMERVSALPSDWQANIETVVKAKSADHTVTSGEILADGWSEKQGDGLRTATQVHAPEPPAEIWDDAPAEENDWDKLGPVKQAGTLCKDEAFWPFLNRQPWVTPATDPKSAASIVRTLCNVDSRKEFATDPEKAKRWKFLVADYRAWQREPAVTDEPSPRREEVGVADSGASAASHHQTMAEAPEVPTAKIYTDMWDSIILGATPKQAKQIHTLWGNQAALRRQIEWTEAHPMSALKKRVADALAFLKVSK